jgi:hypothetical protein
MRHGFPDDARAWSLADGLRRNRATSAAPTVRTCPSCYAAFKPQPICPVCGADCAPKAKRGMAQVDGELQELRRESVQQRIAERTSHRREQGKARTLQQLLALAKERGYSPGWAYKVYAARGGR